MYMYSGFTLLYNRNWHNIKQLYSNENLKKEEEHDTHGALHTLGQAHRPLSCRVSENSDGHSLQ